MDNNKASEIQKELEAALELTDKLDEQLAKRYAEIAALREQVETMIQAQAYAENTILRQRWMMDAQKRTASDAIAERDASIARMERQLSDNLAKAEMLRAQVAELEAWKAAVPVAEIVRYTFSQYDSTTIRPSEDWHKIKDWMDIVSPE